MSKLDEYKESLNTLRIALSVITGMFALGVGGLIARYDADKIDIIFWFGIIFSICALAALALIFVQIAKKTKEIGEL